MTAIPWAARARQAGSIAELTGVVRGFLDTADTTEFAERMPGFAPIPGATRDDIKESVVRLAIAKVTLTPDCWAREHVERLFAFYTEAASRLAHLELQSACRRPRP